MNRTLSYFCLLIVLIFAKVSIGQSKQDYIWFFGKDQNINEEGIQGIRFDFNDKPFQPVVATNGLSYDQNNASICTPQGELLFYTNGCAVANREHQIMPNGDSINAGLYFDVLWLGDCKNGYPGPQDITILQDPSYDSGYYIIHKTISYIPSNDPSLTIEHLKYTYVDMALDGGLGSIVIKNVPFAKSKSEENGYLLSYLSTIAHSNQTDWWIVQPDFDGNLFYTFLLDFNGFSKVDSTRLVGTDFGRNSSASGASAFSPDGKLYAYYNMEEGLWIHDFDRSTGAFSNERSLIVTQDPNSRFSGLEFSPNSRFIYICDADSLFQVDLWESDLEDGKILIDTYRDDPLDQFGTRFFKSTLGPDCRIYIRGGSGSKFMHVIHKPDEKGLDCDFEMRGIVFPQFISTGSFPNFPRYRVDEDQVCDPTITSLFGDDIFYRRDLDVYPNPVRDNLTIEFPEDYRGHVYIIDMQGQVVWTGDNSDTKTQFDVSFLAPGTYSVEYLPEDNSNRTIYTSMLVKVE